MNQLNLHQITEITVADNLIVGANNEFWTKKVIFKDNTGATLTVVAFSHKESERIKVIRNGVPEELAISNVDGSAQTEVPSKANL